MRSLVLLLLLLGCARRDTRPTEPVPPGRDLIPILPYVFFDSGSATIPERYDLFCSLNNTADFVDTAIVGDEITHHHQLLNIIGYRMRMFPHTTITINGHDASPPGVGESDRISSERARVVYDYLVNVWRIDTGRLRIDRVGGFPRFPSMKAIPLINRENRRAEIMSDDWELMRPIWHWRDSPNSILPWIDRYTMIQLKFLSWETGAANDRMLQEYLYPSISAGARIQVLGRHDRTLPDHLVRLPLQRANAITKLIQQNVRPGIINTIVADYAYVGEYKDLGDDPYAMKELPVELPEVRFFSRDVVVTVER